MTKTNDPKYVVIDGKICNSCSKDPIPEDEPIFILRGKDRKALRALRNYCSTCDLDEHQVAVQERITEFKDFRDKYGCTEPDTRTGEEK